MHRTTARQLAAPRLDPVAVVEELDDALERELAGEWERVAILEELRGEGAVMVCLEGSARCGWRRRARRRRRGVRAAPPCGDR